MVGNSMLMYLILLVVYYDIVNKEYYTQVCEEPLENVGSLAVCFTALEPLRDSARPLGRAS